MFTIKCVQSPTHCPPQFYPHIRGSWVPRVQEFGCKETFGEIKAAASGGREAAKPKVNYHTATVNETKAAGRLATFRVQGSPSRQPGAESSHQLSLFGGGGTVAFFQQEII